MDTNKKRFTRRDNDSSRRRNNNSQRVNNDRGGDNTKSADSTKQFLENRVKELEKEVLDLKQKLAGSDVTNSPNLQITTSEIIKDASDTSIKIPQKFEALVSLDFTAISKEDQKLKVKLSEKDIVENEIIIGDTLLVETQRDQSIKGVKVAQRVKRSEVESLVIQKGEEFYAVSQYATHKLLKYEVQSKAVLKGFDITLLLPENNEKNSYYALIKFIEGAGQGDDSVYTPSHTKPTYDPRVIEDDDLV